MTKIADNSEQLPINADDEQMGKCTLFQPQLRRLPTQENFALIDIVT